MQVTTPSKQASPAQKQKQQQLARDLYAFVVFLHKSCNPDLFRALGTLDLTITQIKLLHQLEDNAEPVTLKEAAELLPLSLPATSRTVDDLVRRGFAERDEDTVDRRMKRVTVTDAGRGVIRRLNAARLNALEEFTQNLTDTERRRLGAALEELMARPEIAGCGLEEDV